MRPFLKKFHQFLLCNLQYIIKLNGLGKTHRERLFVVELKLKLRSLFHCEQIAWENSGIKWMKVPSFSLTVTKYLTFQLSGYFLWTIKINCRRFLGRLSTNVMTLLLIQIHSETNIFLSTKVIWEREKRGFISYLSAWGSDRRVCLEILPSRKNEIYLWKMATKVGMYLATYESVTVARGQRKENTDRVSNQSDCKIRYRALSKKKVK